MSDQNEVPGQNPVQFYVPEEQEAGAYAHAITVWNNAYEFVFDFAITQLAQPADLNDPESPHVIPARVVSRVRVPPTLAFDIIKTINASMAQYEQMWGPIQDITPRNQQEGNPDDD